MASGRCSRPSNSTLWASTSCHSALPRSPTLRGTRHGALLARATAVLAGALGIAPAANAATTCTFDPTFHVVSVGMDADGDQTLLAVGPSGDIQVRGTGPVLTCDGG